MEENKFKGCAVTRYSFDHIEIECEKEEEAKELEERLASIADSEAVGWIPVRNRKNITYYKLKPTPRDTAMDELWHLGVDIERAKEVIEPVRKDVPKDFVRICEENLNGRIVNVRSSEEAKAKGIDYPIYVHSTKIGYVCRVDRTDIRLIIPNRSINIIHRDGYDLWLRDVKYIDTESDGSIMKIVTEDNVALVNEDGYVYLEDREWYKEMRKKGLI